MGNNSKNKVKAEKTYTRAQAIKAMKNKEVSPEHFLDMQDPYKKKDPKNPGGTVNADNYHVRQMAWRLLGRPMPFEGEEKTKFLKSIHVKDTAAVVETEASNEEVSE